MDAGDDVSDSASMYSMDRSVMSARQRGRTVSAAAESVKNDHNDVAHRPVSMLKPKVRAAWLCCPLLRCWLLLVDI